MPDFSRVRGVLPFLLGWSVFASASVFVIFFRGKTASHLYLISFNTPLSEEFFKIFTRLGEGWLFLAALVWMFFKKRFFLLPFILAWGLSVGSVQLIKKVMLPENPRPAAVFADSPDWKPVPGVQYRYSQSFPSGHTADAFAVCFALALIINSVRVSLLLFPVALGVALSRVFLSQHFLQDVVAGSFIAIFCTWAVFFLFDYVRLRNSDGKKYMGK